ncbi:MAG: hypothetical protein Unbinned4409contig1001_69 [Prokaryotic dsDNA virus sp.]|mgnify:CR=1 FL=1|nr:MAG: hypothetical protein Unbinned4409contig1001_69 [Prokaryotic dsDNA virus sp.]|tara:strand:+ start:2344 stop:2631 length:288 start_codon:yes stop_codon:yes gene_type:complete
MHKLTYEEYKRDLAVRILRVIGANAVPVAVSGAVEEIVKTLDEFLPKDESGKRGPTQMVDLVCVYEVDCPDCNSVVRSEYTDVHPFCGNCGYTLN